MLRVRALSCSSPCTANHGLTQSFAFCCRSQRFVLVGLMVLYQDSMMQIFVGTLLAAGFLLFQVQAQPYKNISDNFLASVASFCLVIIFLCCSGERLTSCPARPGAPPTSCLPHVT